MAEEYDDLIRRQPGGRLTKADIQRARYGSKLDERRYEFWQGVVRYAKIIGSLSAIAGTVAEAIKLLHITF